LQTRYVTLDDRTQQTTKPLHFDALVTYLQSRACHSGFALASECAAGWSTCPLQHYAEVWLLGHN
jgi:hypothetical protein